MKITADRNVCIQAGNCVMSADAVFDQDDDGVVILLVDTDGGDVQTGTDGGDVQTGEVPDDELDHVREAVKLCPAQALRLVD